MSLDSAHVDVEELMANSRYPRVNPKSGLHEEWDDHFRMPSAGQRSITSLRSNGHSPAVHAVPPENGLSLDFYARLGASGELAITFHGAYSKDKSLYPRRERAQSLEGFLPAHIAFAEPTLRLDRTQKMLLRWSLGGPGWNPMGGILEEIARAKDRTGTKHVLFVGGSGGGHTAKGLSAHVPGSLAYVQAPATAIHRCLPNVKKNYSSTAWPGWGPEKLLVAFPERFNMRVPCRRSALDNFAHYAQSTSDPHYLETHFEPFRSALGATPTGTVEPRGKRGLALYDGEKESHGSMTPPEFREALQRAMERCRARRPAHH